MPPKEIPQSTIGKLLEGQGSDNMGCLIRPDGSYTWTKMETMELLMEKHFPKHKKPRLKQRRTEATGNNYQPRAPKLNGIHPILLQKGMDIILGPLTKILRASVALKSVPMSTVDNSHSQLGFWCLTLYLEIRTTLMGHTRLMICKERIVCQGVEQTTVA
ncbi:hypothetical protein PV325_006708 [Microctonus aethiopoides]|nr:hypothetical protein PV325_006708 [Microctonus aethiopoides]